MQIIQRFRRVVYGIGGSILFLPAIVGAVPATDGGWKDSSIGTLSTSSGLSKGTILDTLTNLMNGLLALVAVLAVIAFVISGIMYLTAAGDEEKIDKAKEIMIYSIVGLVVALIGLIITRAVAAWLTGSGSAAF